MVFAQLTWRDGLRDIVECLNAKHEALSGVLDQSHGTSRPDGRQTLQKALGDRVVFQMDQGQSAGQALLWDEPQHSENADLDSCNDITCWWPSCTRS